MTRDAATGQVVVTADVSGGAQEFRADEVLVALGRRPVTDGLNLDAVEVKTGEVGEIVVTDQLQSSNPRIWAAGDVTGHPEFVYVAPTTAPWSPRTPSPTRAVGGLHAAAPGHVHQSRDRRSRDD